MSMRPGLRKLALAAHLTVSVGWVGAAAAYVALDVVAATSRDEQALRAAFIGMGLIAGSVIVPLAVATLLTGIVMSLGTRWGLLRHWWVVISLVLTAFGATVLVVETGTINAMAAAATDPSTTDGDLRELGNTLVHSIGGSAVLTAILVLNVVKPRGLTPYGWRMQHRERRRQPD
jgi:hypothetical protein